MIDKSRYAAENVDPHLAEFTNRQEGDCHNLGYFSVLRGMAERAVMLELRKRDGTIKAISYAWLAWADFDPSEGIKLYAGPWEVTITGSSLNREVRPNLRLFEAIGRHRVTWMREADSGEIIQAVDGVMVIEEIAWMKIG